MKNKNAFNDNNKGSKVHDLLTDMGHVHRASVDKRARFKDMERLEKIKSSAEFDLALLNAGRFGLEFITVIVTSDKVSIRARVSAWISDERIQHVAVTDGATGQPIASAETGLEPERRRHLAAGEPGTNVLIIQDRLKVHRDQGTTTADPISKGAERDVIGALGDMRRQFEILRHALFDLHLLWKSFVNVRASGNLQAAALAQASFDEQVAYMMRNKRQVMTGVKAMLDDMVKTNRYRYELTVVGGTGVKAWASYR